jgi:hypothetical protein
MTKRTIVVLICLVTLLLPATATAQIPNYSGQWKSTSVTIDPDPGNYSLPGVVLDIKHEGLIIEIRTTTLNSATSTPPSERRFTTDGKDIKSPGLGGGELRSRAYFENGKLIIEGEAEASAKMTDDSTGEETIRYVPYTFRDVYSLSEDGKTLTVVRKIERGATTSIRTTVLAKV